MPIMPIPINALFRSRLFKNKIYTIGVLGNFFARFGGNAVPFILPLMLKLHLKWNLYDWGNDDPNCTGSLFSKPIIRPILQRTGYRPFLLLYY
jgi:hypothetical protein